MWSVSGIREGPHRDVLDYVSRYLQNKDLFERYVSIKTQHIGLNTEITIPRLNRKEWLKVFSVLKMYKSPQTLNWWRRIHKVLKGISWYMNSLNPTGNIFHMREYSWYSQAHTTMCPFFTPDQPWEVHYKEPRNPACDPFLWPRVFSLVV